MFQLLGKDILILDGSLEKELFQKLKTIPELTAALPIVKHLDGGDELWLFLVLQEQLEGDLEARITNLFASTINIEMHHCRVFQLSALPVTHSGRIMQREIEKFVNHTAIPNRLQMRNPEVLEEIAHVVVVGFAAGSGVDNELLPPPLH